jgi:hypothetical protein
VYPDPTLILEFDNNDTVKIPCVQKNYGHFLYPYSTDGSKSGLVKINCTQQEDGKSEQIPIGSIMLTPVRPGSKQTFVFNQYSLAFGPNSVYNLSHIYARTRKDMVSRELQMVGDPCEFLPDDIPFRDDPDLTVNLTSLVPGKDVDASKLGIYRYYKSFDVWYFQDSILSTDKSRLSASITNPAIYAVLLDNVKPEILETYPSKSKPVPAKKLRITAQVKDIGSGVDYKHITAILDKQNVPMDFDPDRDRIFSLETNDLSKGQHQLTLGVVDMAGNISDKKIISFKVY